MGIKKCADKLKKMIISVLCVVLIFGAMPAKSNAGPFQDFIEVILYIPDAVMVLVNQYIGEISGDTYMNVNLKGLHASTSDEGRIYNFTVSPYEIITNGQEVKYTDKNGAEKTRLNLPILNADFFHVDSSTSSTATSSSDQTKSNEILRPAIGNVYKNLRNFCMILMMLVLLYIGIKIMISASAEQQSKYKKNLVDWLVGFALLFIMHYFMVFIMSVNTLVTNMLADGESQAYYISFCEVDTIGGLTVAEGTMEGATEEAYKGGVFALLGGLKGGYQAWKDSAKSWDSFIASDDTVFSDLHLAKTTSPGAGGISNGTTTVANRPDWGKNGTVRISCAFATDEATPNVCVYKGNIMEFARTLSSIGPRYAVAYTGNGQAELTGSGTDNDIKKMAYGIFYLALVIETVMFLTIYIKRLIQLAFLTMIAPFVALMYPVDKIGDGKAQSFDTWLKDYFFGVLIQPIHLLIYTVFIAAASQLFTVNIIYAIAIYVFMIPAEKYIKKIFGFEKGGSGPAGGGLPGAIGHGLGMDALNRFAGIGPQRGGSGGNGADTSNHKIKKISDVPDIPPPSGSGGLPASGGGEPLPLPGASGGLGGGRRSSMMPSVDGNAKPTGRGFFDSFRDFEAERAKKAQKQADAKRKADEKAQKKSKQQAKWADFENKHPHVAGIGNDLSRAGTGAGGVLRSGASTVGRRIMRAATGGQYSDTSVGGKLVGKAIGKTALKTAVRAGGVVLGTTAGVMFSSADAIANGNFDPKKVLQGAAVGFAAGNKQSQNLTSSFENFASEASAQRAQFDENYKADLRRENTLNKLAGELGECEPADRKKYQDLIRKYSPYVDLKSLDDVKGIDLAERGGGDQNVPSLNSMKDVVESFETARAWRGDLQIDEQADAFMKRWAEKHNWVGGNTGVDYEHLDAAHKAQCKEQLERARLVQDKLK